MGWFIGDADDDGKHEGYLIGVVLMPNGWEWRELGRVEHLDKMRPITTVQVGCACGWRSRRILAPKGTHYSPHVVIVPEARDDWETACAGLWKEHAIAERQRPPEGTSPLFWQNS